MTDNQVIREALEPCPFCGGATKKTGDGRVEGVYVACSTQGCENYDNWFTLEVWNRRAPRLEAAAVPGWDDDPSAASVEVAKMVMSDCGLAVEHRHDLLGRIASRIQRFAALSRAGVVREVTPVAWSIKCNGHHTGNIFIDKTRAFIRAGELSSVHPQDIREIVALVEAAAPQPGDKAPQHTRSKS